MPVYKYSGYTRNGSNISGTIEASGLNDAIARVKAEGILPGEVREEGAKRPSRLLKKADETFLPQLTRQLSTLLSAGVPLVEAIEALSAEYKGWHNRMLVSVKDKILAGTSLSKALSDFDSVFPEFYKNMVHSGEQAGALDKVFRRLADYLESQNAVRSKVRSAMLYPIFMTGVSIVVLSFLFTFVIPKIVRIFEDARATLPFITVALIFASNFFVKFWWLLAGILVFSIVYGRKAVKRHRLKVDELILRLPGNIFQSLYYARFSRTLSFLLDGGIPMLSALKLSAKSIGNSALEAAVIRAEGRVAEGASLSSTLDMFPPVFVMLVATGEKSGRLSDSLSKAADSYEEEFNRKVAGAVALFEPAMILVMGLVVGIIVAAVLLPILQLNQLVK